MQSINELSKSNLWECTLLVEHEPLKTGETLFIKGSSQRDPSNCLTSKNTLISWEKAHRLWTTGRTSHFWMQVPGDFEYKIILNNDTWEDLTLNRKVTDYVYISNNACDNIIRADIHISNLRF